MCMSLAISLIFALVAGSICLGTQDEMIAVLSGTIAAVSSVVVIFLVAWQIQLLLVCLLVGLSKVFTVDDATHA
ncbi:hypothetical protein JJD41_10430 [Oxynema sp. CENA135]|nr:hypothetical protein [Oxynema sp. CENA135]